MREVGRKTIQLTSPNLYQYRNCTNETTLRTKGNLLFTSNASMGFETDFNATFIADNISLETTSDYAINAGNTINLQINETSISATSDTIILKAGGIEVVIRF